MSFDRVKALGIVRRARHEARTRTSCSATLVDSLGRCCIMGALALAAGIPAGVLRGKMNLTEAAQRKYPKELQLLSELRLHIEGLLELNLETENDIAVSGDLPDRQIGSRLLLRAFKALEAKWPESAKQAEPKYV